MERQDSQSLEDWLSFLCHFTLYTTGGAQLCSGQPSKVLCALLPSAAAAPSKTYVKLLNPPKKGVLELEVGESHTFYIEVRSEEPFLFAMAKVDAYYPGRGIHSPGGDQAGQGTTALLEITITGKNSTADLPAVCDWPWRGECWDEGVAPISIVAGMRYAGGVVFAEQFPFAVIVR